MILNSDYLKKIFKVINPENDKNLLKRILTNKQYVIFCLRYDEEYNDKLSVNEISNYLNITKQAINQSLNSIYKKILNYCKTIAPYNLISQPFPSRKEQLIESIKELKRLPHDYTPEGKPEKTFIPDGVNQKTYYAYLKNNANKINEKINKNKQITDKEKQILDDLNEIESILKNIEENIEISNYTKQLIETIHIIHRLPKQDRKNKEAEFVFSDGKNQRSYYDSLQNTVNYISKKTGPLTRLERQKLLEYEKIIETLKQYNRFSKRNLTKKQRKEEIIETIKRTHHNPRVNKDIIDKFSNGAVQKFYYNNLKTIVIKLQEESKIRSLTDEEKQLIIDLKEIDEAIDTYCEKQEASHYTNFKNKVEELIKIIHRLQKRPIAARDKRDKIPVTFSDGKDSRNFLDRLLTLNVKINKKIENNEPLDEKELYIKESYKKISNILSFYPVYKKYNKIEIENLCRKFNIDIEKNKSLYNKSAGELYAKIMFLIDNNIEIIDDNGIVQKIMFMSDINMQEKYNVSLEELLCKYINGEKDIKEIVKK